MRENTLKNEQFGTENSELNRTIYEERRNHKNTLSKNLPPRFVLSRVLHPKNHLARVEQEMMRKLPLFCLAQCPSLLRLHREFRAPHSRRDGAGDDDGDDDRPLRASSRYRRVPP